MLHQLNVATRGAKGRSETTPSHLTQNMPPAQKSAITCFLFKFSRTTIFLPIPPGTTLDVLRTTFLEALLLSRDEDSPEPTPLPAAASDVAFWRSTGEEGEDGETQWVRLKDEKSAADKWGLGEAAVVGVSFREGGEFPTPHIIPPPVEQDD